MKPILTEKNCVIVLFVMVLVTFALAQEDSKKMERAYQGTAIGMTQMPKVAIEKNKAVVISAMPE